MAPKQLRIPYEDFEYARFDCVGQYGGRNQFIAFVTGAFPGHDRYFKLTENWREIKRWLAVVHKFDADGNHVATESRLGGFDIEVHDAALGKASQQLASMLDEMSLSGLRRCDIYVKPFSVEVDGVIYSLEYEHRVDENGRFLEYVTLWPNDIMFHPPWDSGEYST